MAPDQGQPAAGTLVSGVTAAPRRLGQRVTADDVRAEAAAAAAARKGGGASGRSSVTLADLAGAGLIVPGTGCITVSYKNQTWTADLAADGAIEFEGMRFSSTTAFSIHCKRKVTPGKQADDGWKSVHYRGQPLGDFRAAYERQAPVAQPGGGAAGGAGKAAAAPTRVSGRQRKKKRFGSDSEGEAHGGDALTDEAYAMFLSAAEHQAQQAQQAQQAAAQQQQTVVVELSPGAEVPDADRWVQCDRCQEWRVVPAENWQAVQEDPREEWFCEYAVWDVTKQPPHKPACKKPAGKKAAGGGSGGGRRGGRK